MVETEYRLRFTNSANCSLRILIMFSMYMICTKSSPKKVLAITIVNIQIVDFFMLYI